MENKVDDREHYRIRQEQQTLRDQIIPLQEMLDMWKITKKRALALIPDIQRELVNALTQLDAPLQAEKVVEFITNLKNLITARNSNPGDLEADQRAQLIVQENLLISSYNNLATWVRIFFERKYMKVFEEYEAVLVKINVLEKELGQKKTKLFELTHKQIIETVYPNRSKFNTC